LIYQSINQSINQEMKGQAAQRHAPVIYLVARHLYSLFFVIIVLLHLANKISSVFCWLVGCWLVGWWVHSFWIQCFTVQRSAKRIKSYI